MIIKDNMYQETIKRYQENDKNVGWTLEIVPLNFYFKHHKKKSFFFLMKTCHQGYVFLFLRN